MSPASFRNSRGHPFLKIYEANMFIPGMRLVLLFALICCAPGLIAEVHQNQPERWPWHGVTLDFRTDAEKLRRLKDLIPVNTIRITLKPRGYAKDNRVPTGEEALAELLTWSDQLLDVCQELGVSAIISMSEFPLDLDWVRKKSEPNAEYKSQRFWESAANRQQIIDTADMLSLHFQNRGRELAAYEFLSEPGMKAGKGVKSKRPPEWHDIQKEIIAVVRKNDPSRWIVMNPGPGGGLKGYHNYQPFEDDKIVYGAHMYAPIQYTHQGSRYKQNFKTHEYPGKIKGEYWDKDTLRDALSEVRAFQEAHGKLIWIGEFSTVRWSPGGRQYLLDVVEIFNSYGWGWAYHSYNAAQSWNPDYDDQQTKSHEGLKSQFVGEESGRWETLRLMFEP